MYNYNENRGWGYSYTTAPWRSKEIDFVKFKGNIETIGDYAFFKTNVAEISFPNSLKSIGMYAFYNTNLVTLSLPDSLKEIKYDAFGFCNKIEELTVPGSITKMYHIFDGCDSLRDVVIGEGVTSIVDFIDCTELTSVKFPNSLESIDGFDNCNDLILDYKSCPNLKTINIGNLPAMPSIVIPDACASVYIDCNYEAHSLEKITLGKNVSSFECSYFYSTYSSLKSINVDEENEHFSSIDGVLYDKKQKELIHYPVCKEGSEFVVPDTVVSIHYPMESYHIKILTVGKNFRGTVPFYGTSLEILNLPHGVTQFGTHPSKVACVPTDSALIGYTDERIALKYYSKYIDSVIVNLLSDGSYKVHVEFNQDIQYNSIRIGSEFNLQDIQSSTDNDFTLSSDASDYMAVFLSLDTGQDETPPTWSSNSGDSFSLSSIITMVVIFLFGVVLIYKFFFSY